MTLKGLENEKLKLILFGGKGGVGKTSCALATSLQLSKDYKTLVISTDPAHSISDSLDQQIGNRITDVKGIGNLAAIEINADDAFSKFKEDNVKELRKLLDTSTNLDDEDINDLLSLPIPGIDEVMSFKTIINLIEEGRFDKYVVDTAPTGHALRLISSPKLLDDWIKVAAKMRWKYRYMITSFSGSYGIDDTDKLLLSLKKTVKRIEKILRDNSQCEFIPVCIPEPMAIKETNRLLADLKKFEIEAKKIIINNVMKSEGCSFCKERKSSQKKYIDQIGQYYKNLNIITIPMMAEEISGLDKLNQLSKLLFNNN